jgi:formylglycine-generating enzyme required for sulfatase activity/tetratricopeptide (TPR) repeat protein
LSSRNLARIRIKRANAPTWKYLMRVVTSFVVLAISIPAFAEERTGDQSGITPEMIVIPAGSFRMATHMEGTAGPVHTATLSEYQIARYEVTNALWAKVVTWATANEYFFFSSGSGSNDTVNLPVTGISWRDAVVWCNALSEMSGLTPAYYKSQPYNSASVQRDSGSANSVDSTLVDWNADGFRLPTEAEWRFAAGGGNGSRDYIYAGSNASDDVGWYYANSAGTVHAVGSKQPNEVGLYDMSGNAKEWCWDRLNDTDNVALLPSINPRGPSSGITRLLRGGGWDTKEGWLEVSSRDHGLPASSDGTLGFRLAKKSPTTQYSSVPDYADSRLAEERINIQGAIAPDMITVPAGSFKMGRLGMADPVHKVTLSEYKLGRYEVTNALWNRVIEWAAANGYHSLSGGSDGDSRDLPVTQISWGEAVVWCNALSEMLGLTPAYYDAKPYGIESVRRDSAPEVNIEITRVDWSADGFRLPTEAEWEYAARYIDGESFTPGEWPSGATEPGQAEMYAWYSGNSSTIQPVGKKMPNALGLFDMSGNAMEMCWDSARTYTPAAKRDPRDTRMGSLRIERGGDFYHDRYQLRVAQRNSLGVSERNSGFRLARSAPISPADAADVEQGQLWRMNPRNGASTSATSPTLLPSFSPGAFFPVGDGAPFFSPGGLATLTGEYIPETAPWLSLSGEFGYTYNLYAGHNPVSSFTLGGGIGITFAPATGFYFQSSISGGIGLSVFSIGGETVGGAGPFVTAKAGIYFPLGPKLDLGMGGGYRYLEGLYDSVWAIVGFRFRRAAQQKQEPITPSIRPTPLQTEVEEKEQPKMRDLVFNQIFPIFYSYYEDHPVGTVVVANTLDEPMTDVSVKMYVADYMNAAMECGTIRSLDSGAKEQIELTALFTSEMLDITEGTKVSAELTLEYTAGGERYSETHVEGMRIEYRNAMTWDDDRKAAAFVTAKDPRVQALSKNIAGMIGGGEFKIPKNLGMAIAFHEALRNIGMSYVVDPYTPYEELSESTLQVDYLQFPRESLEYRAGDCDDLSILYSAMLESVGIETAFITTPGHIYTAFALDIEPATSRNLFVNQNDFIYQNGKTWVPVEVTALDESFLGAWQLGAKQWWEHHDRNQASLISVREAWQTYRPVGLPGTPESIAIRESDKILDAYGMQVMLFIDRQISSAVQLLQSRIRESNDPARWLNQLGVTYARYGLYDQAQQEFQKAIKDQDYVPALVNIGNISFVRGDMEQAQAYYQRAFIEKPEDPEVLLAVARVNHELENYGIVRNIYQKLKSISVGLSAKYKYLELRGDEATRAAEVAGVQDQVLWVEE